MQAVDIVAVAAQEDVQGIGFLAGAAENHRLVHIVCFNEADDGVCALLFFDKEEELANLVVGTLLGSNRNLNRVLENSLRQFNDLLGHGGGEEHSLLLVVEVVENLLDILNESHVKHFVCLVDDEVFGVYVLEVSGTDEVQEAARSGHQDFHSHLQEFFLAGVGLAADEGGRM